MAVPKKKSSRSRRNMRRFSAAYQIAPVAITKNSEGTQVRTHTVTLDTIASYLEAKKAAKSTRKSASKA